MTTAWSAKLIVPANAAITFEPVFAGLTDVVSLYEVEESPDGTSLTWCVEGMFAGAPPKAELAARVSLIANSAGLPDPVLEIAPVPSKDWLTESVASFPPLAAGRFYIHGDHVTGPFPAGKLRLRINAATAFGSGEHASTYGCLMALDGLARRRSVARSVHRHGTLDMGCGSGILALAMAKIWHRPVLAADIDPEAVRVTRLNVQANGLREDVQAVLSEGTGDRSVRDQGPYAVITANILARPLCAMSKDLTGLLVPGGFLILAGLLQRQEAMVLGAYRAQGLRLVERIARRPLEHSDAAPLVARPLEESFGFVSIETPRRPYYLQSMDMPYTSAAERIAALRTALATHGIDGYVVPHADEHQAEYAPAFAERLQWLTGFSGSAGLAVVLTTRAAIFVDGRYTIQVRDQVDGALYEYRHMIDEPAAAWLVKALTPGQKLGFDPKLHTPAGLAKLEEACARAKATLVPIDGNLIDAIWIGQPPRPSAAIMAYPDKFAGRSALDKRTEIAALLKADGLDAFVVSALDSLAWLFNIRGEDVEFSPLVLGYAVLTSDGRATLCVEPSKVTAEVRAHLGANVSLASYDALEQVLAALPATATTVGIDRDTGSRWLHDRVAAAGRTAKSTVDPITAVKARKNPAELDGVRAAHVRDGAALTRFLAWLAVEGPKGTLTEISAADRLQAFRAETNLFRGPSFPTIAGAGGNGAIVHYRASPQTNATIKPDMMLLLDSGGQYLDGTTDVTRTVAIGNPTDEQKRRFTLVLKGHIALGSARFIKGTSGSQLDALARHPLWQDGVDYDHGTGHGVGTFLGVHEGPQRISKMPNTVSLEPGMVISNEPGYYKTGEYGIRIENLVAVREAAAPKNAEKQLLEFETITLAPIDRALIDASLLTTAEKAWLDAYHTRVRETLSPLVDAQTRAWMETATVAI